ncbi:MAG: hypothetical protein RL616_2718 [Verrucomicrobiota bacterium]
MFSGCVYFFVPRPPKEAQLIQNFNEHRIAFEQLRDMLQADTNLSRVASWGVDTRQPQFLGYPTEQNFPAKRFLQYLALLQQANGYVGVRSDGNHADVGVVVWGRGFAGQTRHIWIYWMDKPPTNREDIIYKQIDRNWYLVRD